MRLDRAITDYTSDSREMQQPDHPFTFLPAVYCGIVKIDNREYHLVQVSGILSGNNRLVNIYLPQSGEGVKNLMAIMKESDVEITKGEKAYCIYSTPQNISSRTFPLKLADGNNIPAHEFLKQVESSRHRKDYQLTSDRIIGITLGPAYLSKMHFVILKKNQEGRWMVHENKNYVSAGKDFSYRERSRFLSVLMYAGYIGTVPVDILLSPVYLIYYIIEGPVK